MKVKKGVVLAGLDIRMRPTLIAGDKVWSLLGKELVITSTLDSVHSPGSLHPYGLAVDFRTRYFTARKKQIAFLRLREELPKEFDIVKESTHMHIEYDNKGT